MENFIQNLQHKTDRARKNSSNIIKNYITECIERLKTEAIQRADKGFSSCQIIVARPDMFLSDIDIFEDSLRTSINRLGFSTFNIFNYESNKLQIQCYWCGKINTDGIK